MDQKILAKIKKFRRRVVFFTDRKKVGDFAKVIEKLPENSAIIIREYDLDQTAREAFALEITRLARHKKIKIIVGKDLELAKKIGADGVHFSDLDNLPLEFFKNLPANFLFSFSAHKIESILEMEKIRRPNMAFLSPIFSTTSHKDARPIGLEKLTEITSKYKNLNYLYALGGVNSDNLNSLLKLDICGFGAIDFFCNL